MIPDPHPTLAQIEAVLKPLGWHVQSGTLDVHSDSSGLTYRLQIEAIGGVLPIVVCECGAAAAKTTHSPWCPLIAAPKP